MKNITKPTLPLSLVWNYQMTKKPGWVRPPLTVDESLVVSDATSDAAFCDFILLPLTEEEEEALVARRGVATTPITNRIQRDSLVPVCLITPTTTLLSHR
jgi:hypothetical protein